MRKRRWLAVAILLTAAAATFFLPPIYWRVVGWVKGEAFYDGRPTSWWVMEIKTMYDPYYLWDGMLTTPPVSNFQGWKRKIFPVSPVDDLKQLLDPRCGTSWQVGTPLTDGDEAALSVLRELLHHDDARVRAVAIWGLGELKGAAVGALPAIQEACEDANNEVRLSAQRSRQLIAGKLKSKE